MVRAGYYQTRQQVDISTKKISPLRSLKDNALGFPLPISLCLFVLFRNYSPRSPLHLAAAAGHLPCLYHLVAHAAFINCLVQSFI